jgi:hypothetical protein
MANHQMHPSRRQALGLGAAAYFAAIPSPSVKVPSNPDAALIDLCRQLDADTLVLQGYDARALAGDRTEDQDELDLLLGQWHVGLDEIISLSATTMTGIRAKATALGHALMQCAFVDTDMSVDEQGENYARLAMSLVRDLVGVPG